MLTDEKYNNDFRVFTDFLEGWLYEIYVFAYTLLDAHKPKETGILN